MTFDVRTATPDDGRAIAGIHKETWAATYTPWIPDIVDGYDLDRSAENWARTATSERGRLTVAEVDGEVVGFCCTGPARGDGNQGAVSGPVPGVEGAGEVYAIYVKPNRHGTGIGRALMADALGWLADTGYPECVLWVAEPSTRTRRFYESVGFVLEEGVTEPWRNGLITVRYRRGLTLVQ